jgi:hypothetical protein
VAALVFGSGGAAVYATTQPPPGVYAERVKERAYWVPGASEGTADVRAVLASAAASPPVRGTTILVAEVGSTGVVLTDAPPISGVYVERAGELRAWIAGVDRPSPAQRQALEAAARASAE